MRRSLNPLPAVLLATFISGFAFGVVLPIASVILEEKRVATPLIGLAATMMFVGWVFGSPLAARFITRHGLRITLSLGILITGAAMILHSLCVSLPLWCALRCAIGVASASVFTSCETLINRISTEQNRGRNLGLYGFAFSLSLMIGPFGLWLLQFGTWVPFTVSGVFCCCVAPVMFAVIPPMPETPRPFTLALPFIRRIWVSLTPMFMAGFAEGALISLLPLYTLREGFTEAQTGLLLFAFMAGHGVFQPLAGVIADRVGLKQGLLGVYLLGTASLLVMLFFPIQMEIAGILLLVGASVGALYPLAVGLLAELVTSAELPHGNALTALCYGIGSIVGPLLPALIMHVSGAKSLFAVCAVLYGGVSLVMSLHHQP